MQIFCSIDFTMSEPGWLCTITYHNLPTQSRRFLISQGVTNQESEKGESPDLLQSLSVSWGSQAGVGGGSYHVLPGAVSPLCHHGVTVVRSNGLLGHSLAIIGLSIEHLGGFPRGERAKRSGSQGHLLQPTTIFAPRNSLLHRVRNPEDYPATLVHQR